MLVFELLLQTLKNAENNPPPRSKNTRASMNNHKKLPRQHGILMQRDENSSAPLCCSLLGTAKRSIQTLIAFTMPFHDGFLVNEFLVDVMARVLGVRGELVIGVAAFSFVVVLNAICATALLLSFMLVVAGRVPLLTA